MALARNQQGYLRLYVVMPVLGQVAVLDAITGAQLAVFGTGSGLPPGAVPWGIAIANGGTRAFVGLRVANELVVFNAQTGQPITTQAL